MRSRLAALSFVMCPPTRTVGNVDAGLGDTRSLVRYSTHVVPERQPRSISSKAADDLTFIRSAMERSSAFTAIPGGGGVVMGAIGVIAAVVGARQPTPDRWLGTWLVAAFVAFIVALLAMTW